MGSIGTRMLGLVASIGLSAGCASAPQDTQTLYERLGGEAGVEAIVTTMLAHVAVDQRVAPIFGASNLNRLHRLLQEQFCEVADGPCEYSGFSMLESHRGMTVTEVEFNAVVEALILAMEDRHVATPVQNQLLARLAPLQDEIVYR